MKHFLPIVIATALLTGCIQEVRFEWSNTSDHEITVEDVTGLPNWTCPGVLVPNPHDTNQSSGKAAIAVASEPIPIANQITIRWTEEGKKREFQLQRADRQAPHRPLILPISYGLTLGSHLNIGYLVRPLEAAVARIHEQGALEMPEYHH